MNEDAPKNYFAKGDAMPEGGKLYRKATVVPLVKMPWDFTTESREGTMDGKAGDFIAEDGHGGFYPISAEFHAANYIADKPNPDELTDAPVGTATIFNSREKSLHNSDTNTTTSNVPDVVFFGNGDMFKLLCKASSQDQEWMKSTKAMEIPGVGCVVQVTTQQYGNVAEALVFVSGVCISTEIDEAGNVIGRQLMAAD